VGGRAIKEAGKEKGTKVDNVGRTCSRHGGDDKELHFTNLKEEATSEI